MSLSLYKFGVLDTDGQPHIIYISATIAAVRPAVPREVHAPPCES